MPRYGSVWAPLSGPRELHTQRPGWPLKARRVQDLHVTWNVQREPRLAAIVRRAPSQAAIQILYEPPSAGENQKWAGTTD